MKAPCCLMAFLSCIDELAAHVESLRGNRRVPFLVAMELPKLTLFSEVRKYPVFYGRLTVPSVRNVLATLESLPPGTIVAVFPGS